MSQTARLYTEAEVSVPRASGDEPTLRPIKVAALMCSPRERG